MRVGSLLILMIMLFHFFNGWNFSDSLIRPCWSVSWPCPGMTLGEHVQGRNAFGDNCGNQTCKRNHGFLSAPPWIFGNLRYHLLFVVLFHHFTNLFVWHQTSTPPLPQALSNRSPPGQSRSFDASIPGGPPWGKGSKPLRFSGDRYVQMKS